MSSANYVGALSRWRRVSSIGSAGAIVSAATVAVNGLAYLVPVLAARLIPADQLGALATLLAIGAIASVVGLGLQTALAVRWARQDAVPGATRAAAATAAVTCGLLLLAVPVLAIALHLLPVQSMLLAVLTFPVVLAGRWLGELQGQERFGRLALGMVVLGVARYGGLVIALAVGTGVTAALAAGAAGAWIAVAWLRSLARTQPRGDTRRGDTRLRGETLPTGIVEQMRGQEVVRAGMATLAMLVIAYADLILARYALPAAMAGAYSVGAVLTKGALWAPAVVTVLALPHFAQGRRHALRIALSCVAAIGGVLVAAATLFGDLAMRLAGGPSYEYLGQYAPGFATIGALYAFVFVFVNAEIAAGSRWPAAPLWVALCGIVGAVALFPVHDIGDLLAISAATAAATLGAMAFLYSARRRSARRRS